MNKKGAEFKLSGGTMLLIGAIVVFGLMTDWKFGLQTAAVPAGGTPATGGGTPGTITVINTNPADTATLSFTVTDKLLKDNGINTTYKNATIYVAIKAPGESAYVVSPSVTVPSTSTGASKTGIAVGSDVKYFAQMKNVTYLAYGEIANLDRSKSIEVPVIRHPQGCAGLNVKVYDDNAAAFTGTTCASANNTVNITSISLTAGGASKSYDLRMQINDPYTQFGQTGILIGCDSVQSSKYTVGFDGGTEIKTLPSLAQSVNIKRLFLSNVAGVTSANGLKSIGRVSLQLNAGQTASDPVTCWIMDKANYLKIDSISIGDDVNDDTVSYLTVGSADVAVQLTA